MSTSRSLSDSSLQSWPTHPQPTHVVAADLHQHVWVCEDENLYQSVPGEPCSVWGWTRKHQKPGTELQVSFWARPKSEHIFRRNLFPKIWTRGRGPRALSHLISGADHLDVKQTTESSSERKFTGAGTAWYGDTGYRPGVLIKISLCAVGWRKAASPYLELMNYSSGQHPAARNVPTMSACLYFLILAPNQVSGFWNPNGKSKTYMNKFVANVDNCKKYLHVQAIASLKAYMQGLWNTPSFTLWICISTISFPDVSLLSWLHSALTPVKHAEGPPDPRKEIMFNSNKR